MALQKTVQNRDQLFLYMDPEIIKPSCFWMNISFWQILNIFNTHRLYIYVTEYVYGARYTAIYRQCIECLIKRSGCDVDLIIIYYL